MKYVSTRNKDKTPVSFAQAALAGLAPDGGLYIPEDIPAYPVAVRTSMGTMSYCDLAFETIRPYVEDDIPKTALEDIVHQAYNFEPHLVKVEGTGRYVLELFHGPTAAFKDFGARFMARAFSYLRRGEDKPLTILVATSGDTGGAVADGFFRVPGIEVTVLYPKGRVTPLQERQIAGLGKNIRALAVEGSFDDCQALVKAAFGDKDVQQKLSLSSANSINISRLIPQAVYYSFAAGRIGAGPIVCVPSGNFGNLTAGLYAQAMGAPIASFIAATNVNKTVPDYLESGVYEPRPSRATLSNAMDVGAPSNFERMTAHWTYSRLKANIRGVWVTDDETRQTIKQVHDAYGYTLDPHGAVGWTALDKYVRELRGPSSLMPFVTLETAHPAKFAETVEPLVGPVPVPETLERAMKRPVMSTTIKAELSALKDCLL